jgi:hypothetical protein
MTTAVIQPLQPAGSSACLEFFNPTTKIMALDTIKTSKNHKSFPFTSPTITAHKNQPTGALILEIIFDDVNSTGTNNQGEEESSEENNEGGSDDEGDNDVESNDDSHGHHNDSEEDSDRDNEDDGEDEENAEDAEDSEEDEEYDSGSHELDDKDFANDFNNDLIIDFGNENEEDQLVIEFEDNSPPPTPPQNPVPPANTLPFWFTHEEPEQIRMIFESYGVTLDIEEQRKACVRAPAPFIGSITRTPIKPATSDTDGAFKTLDKVDIYLREMYPLGTMLPVSRVAWVCTTWDANEGVPTHSFELQKSTKKSMLKRAQGAQSSTLYCTPIFRTKEEYQYSVSPQEHSLMYASNSSTNASITRISPFLPEHCRTISFSLE